MSQESRKTPIYDSHVKSGGRMVSFAGWEMPVQYKGIREEHNHVRTKVGLFDVSHMGEIRVRGREALGTLEWVTTNNPSRLKEGEAQYTLFPNEQGGVVDDLIIYCIKPEEDYLLCVNAANTQKDLEFLLENNKGAIIEDESSAWGQIAVQGPEALALMDKVTGTSFSQCPSFQFIRWEYKGQLCFMARTGYTGEDGGEIFVPWELAGELWNEFLSHDIVEPIGLGARDTLRTEMKYPLYGQDISETTNPFEAGLGWVVKGEDFLGRTSMLEVKETGLGRKLVGLLVTGRGIARGGYKVFSFDKKELGEVTSGTLSPSLNKAIAMAYVSTEEAQIGNKVQVEIRHKMVEAEVVKTPFYKK